MKHFNNIMSWIVPLATLCIPIISSYYNIPIGDNDTKDVYDVIAVFSGIVLLLKVLRETFRDFCLWY